MPGNPERTSKSVVQAQINHYAVKSYKEWQKKVRQPDATFEENLRTDKDYWEVVKKATETDSLIERYIPELKKRLGRKG